MKPGKILLILILAFTINTALKAGELFIYDTNTANFPEIKAQYMLFDDSYKLISNTQGAFTVTDNGMEASVTGITRSESGNNGNVSVTFVVDMAVQNNGIEVLDSVKNIIKGISSGLSGKSEIAVTAYDRFSYLLSDFTVDKRKITNIVNWIYPAEGSDPSKGLLSYPAGAVNITEKGNFKKYIVLFSSGPSPQNIDKIISQANSNGISFITVSCGNETGLWMKKLSNSTGGFYTGSFKGRNNTENAALISTLLDGAKPGILSFSTSNTCDTVHNIRINTGPVTEAKFSFDFITEKRPEIVAEPPYLDFNAVIPGKTKELKLSLKAVNGDVFVLGTELVHNDIKITKGIPTGGITIPEGESILLKVKYEPEDSSQVYAKLKFISDACKGNEILIGGGFPNTPPDIPVLKLLAPSCGENLISGHKYQIRWEGVLPEDVIQIEYSTDAGKNWNTLAKDVSGLSYTWNVPDIHNENCLIRIYQLWPNNIGQTIDFRHNGSVNSANFSTYGEKIVTAGKDSVVKIWNSSSGKNLLTIRAHEGQVAWADINAEGTRVVSAGSDNTAKIWDAETGELLHVLEGHEDIVTSANFSPDGKFVVTSSWDKTVRIWDAETGELLKEINCGQDRLFHVDYSRDGKYFVSTGSTGKTKLWDASTYENVKTFDSGTQLAVYASLSPDDSRLVACSWYGRAFVWNIEDNKSMYPLRDTLYSVTHMDSTSGPRAINFATFFNRHGKLMLLTAGVDNARMWDGSDGRLINPLVEHKSNVSTVSANFDGSRILTSSWDSTAKVWNLDKREMQADTTECLFSIDTVKLKYESLVFSRIPFGFIKDTLVTDFIKNNSGFAISLKNIRITGNAAADFEFINTPDDFLEPGGILTLNVRFHPESAGFKEANIEFDVPGKKVIVPVLGECYLPGLQVPVNEIVLDNTDIGDFRDSTLQTAFKNIDSRQISVNGVMQAGPDSIRFSLLNNTESFDIAPGNEKTMSIRFSSDIASRFNTTVTMNHSSEPYKNKIYLFAEGVKPVFDSIMISGGHVSARPGEEFDFPVTVKNTGSTSRSQNIITDLSFNATLLEPLSVVISDTIINYQRHIEVELPSPPPGDSVLFPVRFRAGLGDDSVTTVSIYNSHPAQKIKTVIIEKDGMFSLDGVCRDGGARLFEDSQVLYLSQNNPNPVSNEAIISFGLIESGHTTIKLYNELGKSVETLYDGYSSPGNYTLKINAGVLPAGKYFYIMKTPSDTITKQMEIIK